MIRITTFKARAGFKSVTAASFAATFAATFATASFTGVDGENLRRGRMGPHFMSGTHAAPRLEAAKWTKDKFICDEALSLYGLYFFYLHGYIVVAFGQLFFCVVKCHTRCS